MNDDDDVFGERVPPPVISDPVQPPLFPIVIVQAPWAAPWHTPRPPAPQRPWRTCGRDGCVRIAFPFTGCSRGHRP